MSELSSLKDDLEGFLVRVPIPKTEPERYISFKPALNLRFPDEDTGDWHFQPYFYEQTDGGPPQKTIPLAGKGQEVDTTPSLGRKGVRDMSAILFSHRLIPQPDQPVYVANHYRAIADLAMLDIQKNRRPTLTDNQSINSWLDTAEQIEHLRQEYLEPLAIQLSGESLTIFKQWLKTVQFI